MGIPRHASKSRRPPRRQGARQLAAARVDITIHRPVLQFRWAAAISEAEWKIYRSAISAIREARVPFMLGGGFALATATGRWRDTKDIDLYVLPEHRDRVVAALTAAGFSDYYATRPYDRNWIYRSVRNGVIVDIIWAMANQRARVDQVWFDRSESIFVRGEKLKVLPMEEFVWCKLYIMQRDHCDWTDLFNVLCALGDRLDYKHLIKRLDEDVPLLRALLTIYAWLCPKDVRRIPREAWDALEMPRPPARPREPKRDHIRLLDTRGWFAANHSVEEKLEV